MRSLWENIFRGERRNEKELHELLGRIPLFEALNRKELRLVARTLYRREYGAGEYVFRQGDPGIGMYIIVTGAVDVIFEPTEQLLTTLREGDFFGEVALLNETRRSAAVRARSETTLLCLLEPDLRSLGERSPRVGVKVLLSLARIAGRRLIEISDEYEELRLAAERPEASPADPAHAIDEHVIHEVRVGDGSGQTQPSDDRASAKSID